MLVIGRNGLMNWNITNLLFIFVIMINWREYRVLCYSTKIAASTDAWNLQCRMQSIALASNRSLAKPVTSFFGLQPINDSGDDRGLCITPLESLSISMPFLSNTLHRGWDRSRCSLKIERQWFHKLGIPSAREKREKRNSRFYERSARSKKWKINWKHRSLYSLDVTARLYDTFPVKQSHKIIEKIF